MLLSHTTWQWHHRALKHNISNGIRHVEHWTQQLYNSIVTDRAINLSYSTTKTVLTLAVLFMMDPIVPQLKTHWGTSSGNRDKMGNHSNNHNSSSTYLYIFLLALKLNRAYYASVYYL